MILCTLRHFYDRLYRATVAVFKPQTQEDPGRFPGRCPDLRWGALLLREQDRSLGLIDALNRCLPDPRHPLHTVDSQRTLLAQRIFAIAQGYEDLNDHQSLRQDPLFQVLCERGIQEDRPLGSPSTLCRLENRVDRQARAQVDTIRLKLLTIGARIVCSVRRVVIHLAGGYPLQDLFTRVLERLRALPVLSLAPR